MLFTCAFRSNTCCCQTISLPSSLRSSLVEGKRYQTTVAMSSGGNPPFSYMVELSSGHGDCLVQLYPFLAKMQERGEQLPVAFPETLCYEHHFPRGWYRFETETESSANKQRREQGDRQFKQFRPKPSKEGESKLVPTSATGRTMTRKSAKECDSTTISNVFGKKRPEALCAEIVQRDTTNGELIVQYFDHDRLGEFLLNTPEQCILSKFISSKQQSNDVLIASWTPSVFSVERRVNNYSLNDTSLSCQKRGDTSILSNYTEVNCCPLLCTTMRETIQRLVWFIERHEKKSVLEFKVHFKQDKKMMLWLLWAETLRLAPAAKVDKPFSWEAYEEEQERAEQRRFQLQRMGAKRKEKEKPTKNPGAWPSFCTKADMDVEVLLQVEDKLTALVSKTSFIKNRLSSQLSASGLRMPETNDAMSPVRAPTQTANMEWAPVVPLTLRPSAMLCVHFEEIPVKKHHPPHRGYIAPPTTPRPGDLDPDVTYSIPTLDFNRIERLAEKRAQKADGPHELSAVPRANTTLSNDSYVASDNLSDSFFNDRNEASKQGSPSKNNRNKDSAVPLTVHRLKQRVIAARKPGESEHHKKAKMETQLRTLEGFEKDPVFVENDKRRYGNVEGVQQVHRARRLGMTAPMASSPTNKSNSGAHDDDDSSRSKDAMSKEEMAQLRGLEVNQRIEYNQLKQQHADVVEQMSSLGYQLFSEAQRTREPILLVFDLPRGSPILDDKDTRKLGIFKRDDVPNAPHCSEEYCLDSKHANLQRVFQELTELVVAGCRAREKVFLDRCVRSEFITDELTE